VLVALALLVITRMVILVLLALVKVVLPVTLLLGLV
jgi:hypothetical protein